MKKLYAYVILFVSLVVGYTLSYGQRGDVISSLPDYKMRVYSSSGTVTPEGWTCEPYAGYSAPFAGYSMARCYSYYSSSSVYVKKSKFSLFSSSVESKLSYRDVIKVGNGTATAPSISPGSDVSTGIYFPGPSSMAFVADGLARAVLSTDGLVVTNINSSIAFKASNSLTDSAVKNGFYTGAHYTNAELPVMFGRTISDGTDNYVMIGGGSVLTNAATNLIFYSAASDTSGAGTERMRITPSGNLVIGSSTDHSAGKLQIAGDSIQIRTPKTPATAGAACVYGQWAWDSSYIYICVNTNTWKRTALAAW